MEEEFYATIKFKNGEEVFTKMSSSEEKNETILMLLTPIIVSEAKDKNGSVIGYKVEPWLKTTDEDLIIVKMDDILTIVENKSDEMISIYENYLNNNSNNEFKNYSKISKKMGYVSSIKDAIEMLEKIYNNNPEN
jgi:hypothetical protein